MNQEYRLLFFLLRKTSDGEKYLGKLFLPIEISRNPSKYLSCFYSFILLHCMLHHAIFYNQCALSGVSPQSTVLVRNLCVFPSAWPRKGKFPERRNFVFLTKIIFHMTDGDFLNKGISFSLRKSIRGNINVKPGNYRVHSVCFQSR